MRFICLQILICSVVLVSPVWSQVVENLDTRNRKVTVEIVEYDVERLLRVLSDRYKVSVGFEHVYPINRERDNVISLNVVNVPLNDLLDQMVILDPRYRWELKEGVLRVSPVESSKILKVKISEFSVKDVDRETLRSTLAHHDEVKKGLLDLGFEVSQAYEYDGPLRDDPDISLDLQNTTLEDLLNELLRRGHTRFWSIVRFGPSGKQVSVRF